MAKFKDKILKATTEKQVVANQAALIKLSADFLTETLQARRDWHKIIQVLESKDLQP